MFKRLLWNFCQSIIIIIIVLFVYFIVQTWMLKFFYLIFYFFKYFYEFCCSLFLHIIRFYFSWENPYFVESFVDNFQNTTSVKHLLNELNYTKFWVNYYFYSKYIYGNYCINTAYHYIMNWKPFWYLGVYDLNNPKYSVMLNYYDKNELSFEIPSLQVLDYFWGSYRWRVTEGDLTLMPEKFYYKMFKRFLKRSLRWNYYFSAQFVYLPSFSQVFVSYENCLVDPIYKFLSYIYIIILKYIRYSFLITGFFWLLFFRFVINLNFLYNYLSLYSLSPALVRSKNSFIIICSLIFFFYIITFTFSQLFYCFILLFGLIYFSYFFIFSKQYGVLLKKLLKHLALFLRKNIIALKSTIHGKTKKIRRQRLNKLYSFKILVKIYRLLLVLQKMFFDYSSHRYYNNLILYKKMKRLKRHEVFFDCWDTSASPLLINPQYYSNIFVPTSLKGSRGGLWLRASHKEYAKHLMYENTDALRFFHHQDTLKYFIWQPQYEYGLHFYNQRELVFLNSDNLFNTLFDGVRKVYTGSFNKAHVIGGVSHYDIHRQKLISFDINTFFKKSRLALGCSWVFLRLYWVYMYVTPSVIRLIYIIYNYFLYQLNYLLFFFSVFLRWRTEIISYDSDPEYISYLRFLEFYKLFSYKYFDYYLPKRSLYFFNDATRVDQVYFIKELDGWILRYKFFELDKTGYFMTNGGLQQALLGVLSLLILKMGKWSLLFYKHVPIEFLFFAAVSFISKIWFFHKFFIIFDNYIYKCAHASIWAKKKFVFNSGHVRFHHYFLRCRWKLNKRITPQMGHGRHLHSRKSHYDLYNFF